MTRKELLAKAEQCVCTDREQAYGKPEDNFQGIGDLWYAYLNIRYLRQGKPLDITAEDVGNMQSLLKIGRIASGMTKADNYIDLAGYAACAGEIATTQPEVEIGFFGYPVKPEGSE